MSSCSGEGGSSAAACDDKRKEIRRKIKPSQPFFFNTQQKIDNHEPIEQGLLIAAINRDFANACNFFLSIGAVKTAIKYKDNCLKNVNSFLNPDEVLVPVSFKKMKSKIKKLMHECINDIDRWEIWISEIILITPELLKLYNKIKETNRLCTSEGWLQRSSSQEPTPSEPMGESDDGGGSSDPRNKTSDTIFSTGYPRTEAMSYRDREWLHSGTFGDVQLLKNSKDGKMLDRQGNEMTVGQTETVAYNLSLIWFDFNANLDHWMQIMFPDNKNTQTATEISTTTPESLSYVTAIKLNGDETTQDAPQIYADPNAQVTTAEASAKIVINHLTKACNRPGNAWTKVAEPGLGTFTRIEGDFTESSNWSSITRPGLNQLERRVLKSKTDGDKYREYILSFKQRDVITVEEAIHLRKYADTLSQEETMQLLNHDDEMAHKRHMMKFRQGRSREVLEALARQGEKDTAAGEKYYYDLIFNNDLLTSIHDWIVMQVWGEVQIRAKKHGTSVSAAAAPSSSSSSASVDLPLANWRQSIGSSSSSQQPVRPLDSDEEEEESGVLDSDEEAKYGVTMLPVMPVMPGGSQSRKRRQSKKKNQSRKKKKNKNKSKNKKNKSKNKKKQKKSIKKRRY